MAAVTITYDVAGTPKIMLTHDAGFWTGTIEVDGLAPTRGTTAEERSVGITSLDPPSIRIRDRVSDYDTHRAIIHAAKRALNSAVASTIGAQRLRSQLMIHLRVSRGIRDALWLHDEDI